MRANRRRAQVFKRMRKIMLMAMRTASGAKLDLGKLTEEERATLLVPPSDHGHVAVKEAVLPFNRFPEVDTALGPEMRSTGEVMGIDNPAYTDVLAKSLAVMDASAVAMCRDNNLPIVVFNLTTRGNIMRMSMGEPVGTRIGIAL